MSIPEEAVAAAVKAWRETPLGGDALMNALEAAAPYIQAPTFEEGYGWGYSDSAWSKCHAARERNPYRRQL